MPKKLFHQLEVDKQKLILTSAMEEFSTNTFEQGSINQIIKKAGISRGSFYLYFENKEDVYFYLLEELISRLVIPKIKSLIDDKKNIDAIYEESFRALVLAIKSHEYGPFFKNLYLSYNPEIKNRLDQMMIKTRNELLEKRKLPNDIKIKIDLLKLITRHVLELLVANELNEKEALEKFLQMKKIVNGR